MFTGIIQSVGRVAAIEPRGGDVRLVIDAADLASRVAPARLASGESVASCVKWLKRPSIWPGSRRGPSPYHEGSRVSAVRPVSRRSSGSCRKTPIT